MGGGAHRGPVAPTRQRRTIRLMQIIFVLFALGLLAFAVYSFTQVGGYEGGSGFDAARAPSWDQPIVLAILGVLSGAAALVLRDGSSVRIPTPARLDELAGRAEATALERAQQIAEEQKADSVAAQDGTQSLE
ncbi:MAG: hypothetical protein QOG54_774 [Actinomycetota bacterium]|jgi:hypothetical protein|nr:hypothetical protein [Actinomycetota bacterium]